MTPDESEAIRKVERASADLDRLRALPSLEDLYAMTEMELRALKRERYLAQEALKRSDREGSLALREERLVIQSVMDHKQAERYEGYKITAAKTATSVSAEIDGIASAAWSGTEPPQ